MADRLAKEAAKEAEEMTDDIGIASRDFPRSILGPNIGPIPKAKMGCIFPNLEKKIPKT